MQDGSYLASFRYTAGAVAARNCLHRAPLEGTDSQFHIEYKQFMQRLGSSLLLAHTIHMILSLVLLLLLFLLVLLLLLLLFL